MNLDEIKELIAVMRKNRIKEIEMEHGEGEKVRIVAMDPATRRREPTPDAPPPQIVVAAPPAIPAPVVNGAAPPSPPPPAPAPAPEPAEESKLHEIKSPMVGTFYRAPAPDTPPYVAAGAEVETDTVLCIIEAMKLMNEIKADTRGRVVSVLVDDGQPVEFGPPLFLIEPS